MEPIFENNKNRAGGFEYPFYITTVITENEGYNAPSHWHYHFELLYFTYGTANIQVGNKGYEVKAGELLLINPCEVHSVKVKEDIFSKHFVVGFDPEFILGVSDIDFDVKYLLPQATIINPEFRVLKLETVQEIEEELELTKHEYLTRNIGYELVIASVIYKLLVRILRNFKSEGLILTSNSVMSKINLLNLRMVLNYINDHYQEKIKAVEAADRCFLSYSHFSKLFKRIMRTSFIDYLNHFRIGKAESLLLDGEINITKIAFETGFTDTSYFIKQFKYYKGISPKQYQTLHKEK